MLCGGEYICMLAVPAGGVMHTGGEINKGLGGDYSGGGGPGGGRAAITASAAAIAARSPF